MVVEDKVEGSKKTKEAVFFFRSVRSGMISESSVPLSKGELARAK